MSVEFVVLPAAVAALGIGATLTIRAGVLDFSSNTAEIIGTGDTDEASGSSYDSPDGDSGSDEDANEEDQGAPRGKKFGKYNNPGKGKALGR